MLKLNKFYRRTYFGEDIVAERSLTGGEWTTRTEHVPNNIINNQISNRALVFGNGPARLRFNTQHALNKKSGLLGADTLQLYSCNAAYRDFTSDFLVCTHRDIARELVDSGYTKDNVVYTRVDITLEFPKEFYLIPHDTYTDAGTTAIYLAAFDGHKKIYLLGFDNQESTRINNNIYADTNGYGAKFSTVSDAKWIDDKATVFNVYNDVDFVYVSETGRAPFPEKWKYCTNLRQINYRDFVLEADL